MENDEDISNIVQSDISGTLPEMMITETIETSRSAFDAANRLLQDARTQSLVKRVSTALAHQFGTSPEHIKDCLEDKLRDEIHTVSNPKALPGWLYKIGENHCRNVHKHSKVVKRHEEFVGHTSIVGKRNSVPIAISGSSTPEEELIEKEEAPIWEQRMLDTRARVRRVLTEDVIIASHWGRGLKPQDIALEINKSTATVYRKLAILQKAVIEEIGLIETEENKGLIKEGLRELFANSLEGVV
jgi:DNA-directed RNA polymerase specialized sigma24 family protein